MTPTEELKHEHRVILMVLAAGRKKAEEAARTKRVDKAYFEKTLDFIRSFADRCHHAKEEKQLFVKMVERGFSLQSGPLAVMLQEHKQGRAWVRAAADALPTAATGDAQAVESFTRNLLSYITLLEAHIGKEDNILYPMADRVLTAADQSDLAASFARVEKEETGEGVHEKYHHLAHELAGA